MNKNWAMCYTTKCRRCGKVTEWFVSRSDYMDYKTFFQGMCEKMNYPQLMDCECTEDWTLQDMISFNRNQHPAE